MAASWLAARATSSGARGDFERARAQLGRPRALFERTDDRPGLARVLAHLAYLAADAGQPAAATKLLEGLLRIYTDLRDHNVCVAWVMIAGGRAGSTRAGAPALAERRRRFAAGGERRGVALCDRRPNAEPTAG